MNQPTVDQEHFNQHVAHEILHDQTATAVPFSTEGFQPANPGDVAALDPTQVTVNAGPLTVPIGERTDFPKQEQKLLPVHTSVEPELVKTEVQSVPEDDRQLVLAGK